MVGQVVRQKWNFYNTGGIIGRVLRTGCALNTDGLNWSIVQKIVFSLRLNSNVSISKIGNGRHLVRHQQFLMTCVIPNVSQSFARIRQIVMVNRLAWYPKSSELNGETIGIQPGIGNVQ